MVIWSTVLIALLISSPLRAATGDDATWPNQGRSQYIPKLQLARGEAMTVKIFVQNSGTTTWSRSGGYVLTYLYPDTVSGTMSGFWGTDNVALPDGVQIAPGEIALFTFTVVAPNASTLDIFQWKLTRNGVQIGHTGNMNSAGVSIGVEQAGWGVPTGDAAAAIGTVAPSAQTPLFVGQVYPVRVRFLNIGTRTWQSGSGHKIVTSSPIWSSALGYPADIPYSGPPVPPGELANVDFTMSPQRTGETDYILQFRMLDSSGPISQYTYGINYHDVRPAPPGSVVSQQPAVGTTGGSGGKRCGFGGAASAALLAGFALAARNRRGSVRR
ncbi:MAG: hypothetical protein H0V44_10185 [Planctomycetes bacterium]|nr:hypothetical protein [Planctomycetota bacterium]